MNYGMVRNLISATFTLLDANALSTTMERTIWVSLTKSDEGIFLGYSPSSREY